MQLEVFGQASQSIVRTIEVNKLEYNKELLKLLVEHNLPMASSCSGLGVCKLCLVNETILSCEITVGEYFSKYGTKLSVLYL